jgi:four helix bundle protein
MKGKSEAALASAGAFEFNFEKLTVWRKAVDLAGAVYAASGSFPDDERFGLTAQMRRAGVSVASNLAEGSSRTSRTGFARFIELATGSVFEWVTQAEIACRQGFLAHEAFLDLRCRAGELTRILSGLRRSLRSDASITA